MKICISRGSISTSPSPYFVNFQSKVSLLRCLKLAMALKLIDDLLTAFDREYTQQALSLQRSSHSQQSFAKQIMYKLGLNNK